MSTRPRTVMAVIAVLTLGIALLMALLSQAGGGPPGLGPGAESQWLIALPMAVALVGLATGRSWSRWLGLGLAIGIAVLPWAVVLTFDALLSGPYGIATLVAAILLVAAYDFQFSRYLTLFIVLMAGLLIGILFLARQRGRDGMGHGLRIWQARMALPSLLTHAR